MNKKVRKRIAIIAIGMICAGSIMTYSGYLLGGSKDISLNIKDGLVINTSKERYKETISLEEFNSIEVECNSNIEFLKSDKYELEFDVPQSSGKISYSVKDKKLIIKQSAQSKNNFNINLGFEENNQDKSYIKIYAPKEMKSKELKITSRFGNINICPTESDVANINSYFGNITVDGLEASSTINMNMNNGKLNASNIKAQNINVSNKYGGVKLENVNCNGLDVTLNNGKYIGNNVSTKNYTLKNSYGNNDLSNSKSEVLNIDIKNGELKIDSMNSGNANIVNNYGKVYANALQTNDLKMNLTNGNAEINGEFKGTSEINSKYGNVLINTSLNKEDYDYDIKSDFGKIKINDKQYEKQAERNEGSSNILKVKLNNGDVNLSFK
ncbi:DUF4097 family beta strand repeat-containing protein [Clostridium sp. ATCC 25772]|uniref:DUF4097 family beta strand repeat-containing protein n=1 Tax=Clostridium sp. ATCC 25772 TaxID=1676991 RepID=UPI000781F9D7|nr:DUF4097 family beta strand repeat-containing protein [Clostridium sp. ATCC 25772]